jgi:hypothetical protein
MAFFGADWHQVRQFALALRLHQGCMCPTTVDLAFALQLGRGHWKAIWAEVEGRLHNRTLKAVIEKWKYMEATGRVPRDLLQLACTSSFPAEALRKPYT